MFLVALSLLMVEVALTRIFSLVMWYYFAVLSISLALLGTAVGGICIYLFPAFFHRQRLAGLFPRITLAYSISLAVSLLVFLGIPVIPEPSLSGALNLTLVYLDLAVPFFLGGLCLSLAITNLSSAVSTVYFADLLGACAGCLLVIPALDIFGGPGTIILAAGIAAVAALAFQPRPRAFRARSAQQLWAFGVLVVLLVNARFNVLDIQYVKGLPEPKKLFEGWNSFSRVAVFADTGSSTPFSWGLSTRYPGGNPGWMRLNIDGMAETPITRFDGTSFSPVNFLAWDISSFAYNLKKDASVLVIGPGGGRDVLAALLFGEKTIQGVELNPLVVNAVRDVFAKYDGNIYGRPDVSVAVDDGRNYLAKSSEQYDIILASAVDTWAATAAGAFALSENTLYTQEAFQTYRNRLAPEGVLSVSRYIYPGDQYGEALRLTGVALSAWQAAGVSDPRQYLVVAATLNDTEDSGYINVLMKKSPFTQDEVDSLNTIAAEKGFTILYAPFGQGHGAIQDFVQSPSYEAFWKSYPIDVSPATDDRPFFFQMLRFTDLPSVSWHELWGSNSGQRLRFVLVATLGALLLIVTVLTAAFVLGPMWIRKRDDLHRDRKSAFFLTYFTLLGTGFMMLEVGLIQKFVLFVGHPTYAFALILFALLLGTSLGSYATRTVDAARAPLVGGVVGLVMAVGLPLYISLLAELQDHFMGAPQLTKEAIAFAVLFPLGLLLGIFFPIGIKRLSAEAPHLIPWCWAVNGAASVFASVFALAIGLQFGMTAELMVGWATYVLTTGLLLSLALSTFFKTFIQFAFARARLTM